MIQRLVEDKIGVTERNKWGLNIVIIFAAILLPLSGLLLFLGGRPELDLVDFFWDVLSYVMYSGMAVGSLFFIKYLMKERQYSVYLLEPKMGISRVSENKVLRNPVFKIFVGVLLFSGVALLASFLGKFAGNIPRFQVLAAVQIWLSWEPTVLAETLFIVVLYLTLTRRFVIKVTGGQNEFFFIIMLLLVCTSLFFIGMGWHKAFYSAREGDWVMTGFLFWIFGVLTVVFGDIIFAYVLHAMLNIFNSAQEIFSSDFYKYFMLSWWLFFLLLTIIIVLVIINVKQSQERKEPLLQFA